MITRVLWITILLVLAITAVYADDEDQGSSLYYVKFGVGMLSADVPSLSVGLGGRYRMGHHGFDLSLSGQALYLILYLETLLSAKAQYLYYPNPHENTAIFYGGGVGYGSATSATVVPMCGYGSASYTSQFLSANGVIGCEFRRDKMIKPLIQFEVSQPVINFQRNHYGQRGPSFALSAGFGW